VNPKVIIVGAGLAGLCCARHLHRRGVDVVLLEQKQEVGGRLQTTQLDGFVLDHGFQVYNTAYPEGQQELNYQALDFGYFDPGAYIFMEGQRYNVGDPLRQPSTLISTLQAPIGSVKDKMLMAKLSLWSRQLSHAQLMAMPVQTTLSFLRGYGFSSKIIANFFQPFFGGVFLEKSLHTSHHLFLYVFSMLAKGKAALPKNGMQAIAQQLSQHLPNDQLLLGHTVESIQDGRVTCQNGKTIKAQHIVLAVEQHTAQKLLGQPQTQAWVGTYNAYFEVDALPIEHKKICLMTDRHPWIQNICFPSMIQPSYAPKGRNLMSVSVNITPEEDRSGLAQRIEHAVIDLFDHECGAIQALAQFEVPYALPYQEPQTLLPWQRPQNIDQGLWVCGDWLDQGSIQGAMVSGRRVAEQLC
jgi:phytoene dehydrogenase-like protein